MVHKYDRRVLKNSLEFHCLKTSFSKEVYSIHRPHVRKGIGQVVRQGSICGLLKVRFNLTYLVNRLIRFMPFKKPININWSD